jgi:NAD(P)-dependent dehydrogenase (short-subunit alcohol dehydrogenase family)
VSLNPRIEHWQGRTVWVVGASSGIGQALAQQLHAAGATVLVSARNEAALQDFVARHPGSHALPLDVTDRPAMGDAMQEVLRRIEQVRPGGMLDMVVFCAGYYRESGPPVRPGRDADAPTQVNVRRRAECAGRRCCRILLQRQNQRPPQPDQQRGRVPRPAQVAGLRADQGRA